MLEIVLKAVYVLTDLILRTALWEKYLTDRKTHTMETKYRAAGVRASKW